jgi:N-methylhydantoinase A
MPSARLAVDIGGTFTDLALEHDGRRTTTKILTTPAAPEQGVMAGVCNILQTAAVTPADIGIVIHGTTLATNAIIERRGARTALLTTHGFRDVIAMGNESRYDQYDLNIVLPEPLVPRHLRLPIRERLDREGNALLPLDGAQVRALVPVLRRERVESIAVGLLHAFVNPQHERQVREILAEELEDVPISLSSDVSPEMREWERFSTTVANAYVQPLMARYLRRLAEGLHAIGVSGPIFLMQSGGGLTTIDTACRYPIRLVESGPAGGAIFSATIARQCDLANVVSFDMGGTTAKICLIDNGKPQTARAFEIARVGRFRKGSGLPLRIPVIEMVEIGAGGGSIAQVDTLGRIAVGPRSAGADPGPACYGRGGAEPTVTDANLALGRYDPTHFAGGTMRLDTKAARDALAAAVGGRLGLGTEMAALGVIEIVDENMANAARVHAIESGKTHQGRTLIAFGGGGPVHACRVAEKVGIRHVLVPSGAGVGSAIGFLRAPVGYEVVRSLYQRLTSLDVVAVNALLREMQAEAMETVARGSFGAPTIESRMAYMRYVGQGHEIPVPLPLHALSEADVAAIRATYDAEYSRVYDRPVPGSDVEIMSYAVLVATVPDDEPAMSVSRGDVVAVPEGRPVQTQLVCDTTTAEATLWPVYDRATLACGVHIVGPAIIAEEETSTLVTRGWNATVNGRGYIELTQEVG